MPHRFVVLRPAGKHKFMSDIPSKPAPPPPDPDLVASRARALTPEEQEAGVDDPGSLADAVLADSEIRTFNRTRTAREHRRSEDTVEPPD
jgi:hypothetical protein